MAAGHTSTPKKTFGKRQSSKKKTETEQRKEEGFDW